MRKVIAVLAIVAAFAIGFAGSAVGAQDVQFSATSCIKCLERCADLGYTNHQCLTIICTEECGTGS